MENKLRNPNYTCISNSNQPNFLDMHKNSHKISKMKPKIRIIHVYAPEIIKTDAENFRELVQKLTGKPSEEKKNFKNKTRVIVEGSKNEGREQESSSSGSGLSSEDCSRMVTIKNEVSNNGGFWGLDLTMDKVKEEVGGDERCGGYLGGFSDLEGFISEINGGFPLFPLDHATHNMQGFEQYKLL